MDILYLLIPVSVVLVFVIAFFFRWSLKAGQFEDLEGPAYRILMDDDRPSMDGQTGPERKGGNSIGNEPGI
jgi:cbb3-type cytochrome oxidase maturation protein